MNHAAPVVSLLILAGCSGTSTNDSATHAQAGGFENAAEQRTPAAIDVPHNEAGAVREIDKPGTPPAHKVVKKVAPPGDDATQAPVPGTFPVKKRPRPTDSATDSPLIVDPTK